MTQLTRDQEQRVFREHIKPERSDEEIMKKYGLSVAEHKAIVAKYSVCEHPNDVGNATEVRGDVVSSKDTGSGATEKPIQVKNTREVSTEYEYFKAHEAEAQALARAHSQAGRTENISAPQVLKEKSSERSKADGVGTADRAGEKAS